MVDLSQESRLLRIDSPLGADVLILQGLSGEEGISRLFRFQLDLVSSEPAIAANDILGKAVTCKIALKDKPPRFINGYVVRFGPGEGVSRDYTPYAAEIVPWFWFLSHTTDCRVWQNKSSKDILEQIFADAGFTAFDWALEGDPPRREYVIQYNESDYDFACRLMEEDGLFWYFVHADGAHTLMIGNSNAAFPDAGGAKLVSALAHDGVDTHSGTSVQEVWVPGKVATADYEFRASQNVLTSTKNSVLGRPEADKFEVSIWPGRFPTTARGSSAASSADGDPITQRMVEAIEAQSQRVSFSSGAAWLAPGHRIKIGAFAEDAASDRELVVESQSHQAVDESHLNARAIPSYGCGVVAFPADLVYRPAIRSKPPAMPGLMSAVVVGPAGEEINVDEFGRVKVQFHWDRLGGKDDNSSCWCRLSQAWAGEGWGMFHFPRIGSEVLVGFLDGDPDHPVVIGQLHNGQKTVPIPLPDEKTKTGFITRSTTGGGASDFNAFWFDDKAGSEKVYFQAQKDYERLVKNNETVHVKADRSFKVDGKQDHVTKGNYQFKVTQGDHKVTIDQGNRTVQVKMGNYSTKVDMGNMDTKVAMGNYDLKTSLGKVTIDAMQEIMLKVGGSSVKIDQMGVTIKGMMVKIEGTVMLEAKGLMTKVNGDAMLMIKGGIVMIN
jgi:type VI secretion system secreted protein VgrG